MVEDDDIDCLDLQGPASCLSGLSTTSLFVPLLPVPPILPQTLKNVSSVSSVQPPLPSSSSADGFLLFVPPDVKVNPRSGFSDLTQESVIKPEPVDTALSTNNNMRSVVSQLASQSTRSLLSAGPAVMPEFSRPLALDQTQPYSQSNFTSQRPATSLFEQSTNRQSSLFASSQTKVPEAPKMLSTVSELPAGKHVSLFSSSSQRNPNRVFELPSELPDFDFKHDLTPRKQTSSSSSSSRQLSANFFSQHVVPASSQRESQQIMSVVEVQKRIPGPAGDLQIKGLQNKRSEEVGSKYSFNVEGSDMDPEYDPVQDEDFSKGPWLAVLRRMDISCNDQPSSPAALQSTSEGAALFAHNTKQLQEFGSKNKVPTLAAIVKAIVFWNENASVTFKDPWGTIEGSVHAQVWKQFPRLTVGSAVILSNITVFTPQSGNHYLNVVAANICEVYHVSIPAPASSSPSIPTPDPSSSSVALSYSSIPPLVSSLAAPLVSSPVTASSSASVPVLSSPIPVLIAPYAFSAQQPALDNFPRQLLDNFPFNEPSNDPKEVLTTNAETQLFLQPSFQSSPLPLTPTPLFSASPLPSHLSRMNASTKISPIDNFPFSSQSSSYEVKRQRVETPMISSLDDDVDQLLDLS